MKNIYADALESFTFAEMFEALSDIGAETQRLDFKREIAPKNLAHKVSSFAIADGGIIVVGFADPTIGQDLKFAGTVDVSDRKIRAFNSTVNAWVKPQPKLAIHGYSDDSTGRSFLVVRVDASVVGPVEYLGSDASNLPVRDGTTTRSLSLGEIEALQRRTDGIVFKSPLAQRDQRVALIQSGTGGDFYFGVTVEPKIFLPRRIMDPDDNQMCYEIEEKTRGANPVVHPPLSTRETLTDGVWLHDDAPLNNLPTPAPNQLQIDSDGHIVARFAQRGEDLLQEYFGILLTGYTVAQEVFYRFGLAPRAQFAVMARLNADARNAKVAQFHDHSFEVELARETFADGFATPMMLMFRTAGKALSRIDVYHNVGGGRTSFSAGWRATPALARSTLGALPAREDEIRPCVRH